MNKEQELRPLPCPFCGGDAIVVGHGPYRVACMKCTASLPHLYVVTEAEAIAVWNRRAPAVAAGGVTEEMAKAALALLAAEDDRQDKLHDLLETIREQIRLHVAPEHRPDGLMTNIQNAVYAMRGRTRLMNDAALTAALAVGDEGIREGDLVTAVWELLRTVHQPTPKAGSDYWHVTAGKHVEFGKLITKLHSLLDFPTPPSRGEGE